jgi:hypothetical protein
MVLDVGVADAVAFPLAEWEVSARRDAKRVGTKWIG